MGQNIGTCITAVLSAVGANKNAKRAAFVHLSFNVIGSAILITVYCIMRTIFAPAILDKSASLIGIAICHSMFNILCVMILMPLSSVLEKMALKVIKDTDEPEEKVELDERLLSTPPLALEQCKKLIEKMAKKSERSMKNALKVINEYDEKLIEKIKHDEDQLCTTGAGLEGSRSRRKVVVLNVNDPQFLLLCPVNRFVDFCNDFLIVFRDVILQVDHDQCTVFHIVVLHKFHVPLHGSFYIRRSESSEPCCL